MGGEAANVNIFDALGRMFSGIQLGGNEAPRLQAPNANSSTPNRATASTTVIQNQQARDKNALATSTFLTGGAGLLEPPTTTSRVLLGE